MKGGKCEVLMVTSVMGVDEVYAIHQHPLSFLYVQCKEQLQIMDNPNLSDVSNSLRLF